MKGNGESDGDILSWLINDLNLVGPFNLKLNARLLRSTLTPAQIQNYEEGFGWLLSKQQAFEEAKPKKPKQLKKGTVEQWGDEGWVIVEKPKKIKAAKKKARKGK